MIYILTVYWKSNFWVPIQLSNISKFSKGDIEILAFRDADTENIDLAKFGLRGRVLSDGGVKSHAEKLNILAEIVCTEAEDDDILVFLDSDAFPITEYESILDDALSKYDLCAVRRDENQEPQPHPCFCALSVKVWKEISGDWRRGPVWEDLDGYKATDVGARLIYKLANKNKTWRPFLRSNRINLHNAFYGVYEDFLYHHGAGSRRLVSRLEIRWLTHSRWFNLIPGFIRVRITRYVASKISKRNLATDEFVRSQGSDTDKIKKLFL